MMFIWNILFTCCPEAVNNTFLTSSSSSERFLSCLLPLTEPHHIPSHLITPLSLNDIPPRIAQTMENEDSWDFDIVNLEAATLKRWGSITFKSLLQVLCLELLVNLPCWISPQAFDLFGPEDFLPLWCLRVPELPWGHAALLATSDRS